jgi:hypothetical protein
MAGVKTKKGGGQRRDPVWHGGDCSACGKAIESHVKATRVKLIAFEDAKRIRGWDWRHKACVGGGK